MKAPRQYITLIYVTIFAIAMGYLESAVVIYIRELYYPEGFAFPLKLISNRVMITELGREAATMVMLLGVGLLAGRTALQRFSYFIYSFAVWDIFYYVFLWILIGWPQSLMTWDVLFFIPTTWVGPVIAPVINSLTMILLATVIILKENRTNTGNTGHFIVGRMNWMLLILGSIIILIAYTLEFTQFILQKHLWQDLLTNGISKEMLISGTEYMPRQFPWGIFIVGELMHLAAVGMIWRKGEK